MISKIKSGSTHEEQKMLKKTPDSDLEFIAHVRKAGDESWQMHLLDNHLKSVAALARRFAQSFGTGEWAYLAGLWHDLGKYSKEFQNMIRSASGFDAHIETQPGRVDFFR